MRPMTMGALTLPVHQFVKGETSFFAIALTYPTNTSWRPWKAIRSCAILSQRCRPLSLGKSSSISSSVTRISSGSPERAAQRNGPCLRRKAGVYMPEQIRGNRKHDRCLLPMPFLSNYYHIIKRNGSFLLHFEHQFHVLGHGFVAPADVLLGIGFAQYIGFLIGQVLRKIPD